MNRLYALLICLLTLPLDVCGSHDCRVKDARIGEPLVGTTVYLRGTGHSDQAQLDGFCTIRNVAAGEYELIG